jgi:DHA2 family multidrug resistance protein
VPFGILSFLGISIFMSETPVRRSAFDFFGFAALSCGIGALQLMLDRGQLLDWWSSTEIVVEAVVSGLGFYLFIVHMLTTRKTPFVSPALFKDRNFVTGNFFIFIVGVVLFATLALLPPLLQDLLGYPVVLTGLVTAPRGIGTLAAMFIVGRLMGKVDARLIIAAGFALTAVSLWQMTGFYLQMDTSEVIWSGLAQGLGTGFVYVPLAAVTFATLAPQYRNEGTALFSLVRNLGSSIGISAVETLLTRNSQIMHARLAEHVSPFNPVLRATDPQALASPQGLAMLDHAVTVQGAMIAYDNDFKLMLLLTLCAIPLVMLLRSARAKARTEDLVVE